MAVNKSYQESQKRARSVAKYGRYYRSLNLNLGIKAFKREGHTAKEIRDYKKFVWAQAAGESK